MYVMYTPLLIRRTPCLRKNSLRQSLPDCFRDNFVAALTYFGHIRTCMLPGSLALRRVLTKTLYAITTLSSIYLYFCIEVKELYVAEHALKITTYQIEQILEKICSRLTSLPKLLKNETEIRFQRSDLRINLKSDV